MVTRMTPGEISVELLLKAAQLIAKEVGPSAKYYKVLTLLYLAVHNRADQGVLASKLQVAPPTFSRAVSELAEPRIHGDKEYAPLIEVSNAKDQRRRQLSLTRAGWALVMRIQNILTHGQRHGPPLV